MMNKLMETRNALSKVKEYTSLVDHEHSLAKTIINLEHSLTELEGNTSLFEVASIKATIVDLHSKLYKVQASLHLLEQVI